MSHLTLHKAKTTDISLAATLIARTYLDLGARMIELTGQLRALPNMKNEYGVLVADEGEEAVGYALFTPVKVGKAENAAVLLAPLAYDATREDINPNAVLEKVLNYVREKNHRYVLMHGDVDLYQSLGFKDAEDLGITTTVRYPNTILLVKDFGTGGAEISGEVHYPDFIKN